MAAPAPRRETTGRLRTAVRAVVVLLVAVLSALAVFFWVHSEHAAVEQYNRFSLTLARLGAMRIEENLTSVLKRLSVLARTECPDPKSATACPLTEKEVLADLMPLGAINVIRIDPKGAILRSAARPMRNIRTHIHQALEHCPLDQVECIGFSASHKDGPKGLAIFSVAHNSSADTVRTIALMDWSVLGQSITEEVAMGPSGLAWLLDDSGRIVFHPASDEICNEVQTSDARCHVCHGDSAVFSAMRTGHSGVGSLELSGTDTKLVAFAPVLVAGQKWSIAVAVPYATVVRDNRQALVIAILVSSVLIGLFLAVTYFLDWENRKQIGALQHSQTTIREMNSELEHKIRARTDELHKLFNEVAEFRRTHENRERLAIVGELAAMVAHEIRNPLHALAINSDRLLRKLKSGEPVDLDLAREMVESQIFETRRINDYIEQYLRLARLPKRQVVRSNLNELIGELLKFLEVEAKRLGVRLHFEHEKEPLVAQVDEDQIHEVLLNLMVNSFQAMPAGGELTLSAAAEDEQVAIRIHDTGAGIAQDKLTQVFKPFFSTREGGTGLGLAICARIIKEHKGELTCDSEVGRGTTFTIRIPIVHAEEA
jgi:signal transduction histidine kinase